MDFCEIGDKKNQKMEDKKDDPAAKKIKTKAEESDSEGECDDNNVAEEEQFWEYADIKTRSDLLLHMGVSRKKALKDRRYLLWIVEHALFEWFNEPKKYKAAAVSGLQEFTL